MNNSLKIGIVAGLLAGLVAAIVFLLYLPMHFKLGLIYFWIPPPPETPFTNFAAVEITLNLIWGIILGMIYSRVYRVIPGKAIVKGLLFGLFCYLIINIGQAYYNLIYTYLEIAKWNIIAYPLYWIAFGLILGILYEFLHNRYNGSQKEPKIIEYDMRSGIQPGAIAGFFAGATSFISMSIWLYTGVLPGGMPRHLIDLSLIISQLGSQIMIHMVPKTFLGAIYAKVYNLVPGKGITKGLCFSLVASYLIIEIRIATWCAGYGLYTGALAFIITGGSAAVVCGIVLGYLYKPPK